jgi:formylglycine-generating enzyme required for sulfatase activity
VVGLWAVAFLVGALSGCGGGKPEDRTVTVRIDSAPESGAEVLMQGAAYGTTPATVQLTPGFYDVVLRSEDYKLTTDRLEVTSTGPNNYTIEMAPLVGRISWESEPSGATVLLDGNEIGKTPLFGYEVPVGDHEYTLQMENYYPLTDTITVEEDFKYQKSHKLEAMEGTLLVTSRPTGVTIYLNNQRQTETSPARFKLSPGTYVVGAHTKGFVHKDVKVELPANDEYNLTIELVPGKVPEGMVLVPAGPFKMGANERAPDEAPLRTVEVDTFYIDKFEVTNEAYKAVFPEHSYPEGQGNFPATGISWRAANRYAKTLGKRLPTETEWEKAARGEDGREYPWGNEYRNDVANTYEAGVEGPAPVGKYLAGASPYGCMDMAGNVYEWTQNWYEAYPGNEQVTADYGEVFRVLRGGSYETERFDARCARRHFDKMDAAKPEYGFRCVMDVADDSRR